MLSTRHFPAKALVRAFSAASGAASVPSFGRQIFLGKIANDAVYPYPEVGGGPRPGRGTRGRSC